MGLFSKKHSIGKTIAELRKGKGWTQIELAEKLQVSDKAVSKWEKDNGAPSVEFFPVLAELFDVSIDYLMTGKSVEPEIIAMSKIELCAKNDDVKLFESLTDENLRNKDENGNTILDYLLKYESKKVILAFFARFPATSIIEHNGSRNGCPFWYTEKVLELLIRNNLVKELEDLDVFSTKFYGKARRAKNGNNAPDIYTKGYRSIILTDKDISDELKIKYFQSCTAQQVIDCLNDLVEVNDKKQIEMLWNIIKPINEKNIAGYEQRKKQTYSGSQVYVQFTDIPNKEYEPIGTSCNYYFFVVAVPVSLIEKLLDKGYIDIARQANEFNKKIGKEVLNEEKFAYVEGKNSGKMTQKDLTVLKFTKNGIVDIDALLQTKDFKTIKEVLMNNPIQMVELLYNWLKAGNMRELFRYAVDNNLTLLANHVVNSDIEKIKAELVAKVKKILTLNGSPAGFAVRGKSLNAYNLTIEEYIAYLNEYKQQILSDLSYELDKEKTIKDLTKEYFEAELAKGNIEIVIIKLCVRLEAILRCDFHYEGDFSEMLNGFCNRFETYDDESNNYDPYTPRILNKLRIQRNGIVHSEKAKDSLSMDEIKFCVDYICNLG